MPRKCTVVDCLRERLPDALVCRVHMGDLWGNRLDRTPAGFVPEWRKRLTAKDMTHAA